MKIDVKKLENAQVEISVVLENKKLEEYRQQVEKEFLSELEIDGFRKGKVSKDVAREHIEPMRILEEMAHQAISNTYVEIIKKEDIKAIGQPQIAITKIAEGSELEFKITTAVLPMINLGDYKTLAKEQNKKEYSTEVKEEEVQEAILGFRKMRAQQDAVKNQKEGEDPVSFNDIKNEDLPELTDEWVKTLGNFDSVEIFMENMKENLVKEKEAKNHEKRRIAIIEAILESCRIDVPDSMLQYELDKMLHEFEGNISMTGTSFDEYLTSINKTRDDYRNEWRDQATKRAQTEIILNYIAEQEKIEPSDELIVTEVSKIMDQYKDQKGIDEQHVRAYIANTLTHKKVFEFLDEQK